MLVQKRFSKIFEGQKQIMTPPCWSPTSLPLNTSGRMNSTLIMLISIADFSMGCYLLAIALVDTRYGTSILMCIL